MTWYDNNWSYRKSVTLSRASGAVTNYQMRLLLGESSGASGEDVDCGGLCASDFDDIRFTAADGTTLLDYWIESISGVTPNQLATIWIEFDSIGTGATTFYLYFGNASASAASSGANTFIKFEDFEWGADGDNIDTNGGSVAWSKTANGSSTAKIDTGQKWGGSRSLELYHDGTNSPNVTCSLTASDNNAIQWRVRKNNTAYHTFTHGNGSKRPSVLYDTGENIQTYDGSAHDTGLDIAADTWVKFELRNLNYTAGTCDLWVDDTELATSVNMGDYATYANVLFFNTQSGTASVWIDEIIVRNWRATEPAWGSWGSVENSPIGNFAKVGTLANSSISKINTLALASITKLNKMRH